MATIFDNMSIEEIDAIFSKKHSDDVVQRSLTIYNNVLIGLCNNSGHNAKTIEIVVGLLRFIRRAANLGTAVPTYDLLGAVYTGVRAKLFYRNIKTNRAYHPELFKRIPVLAERPNSHWLPEIDGRNISDYFDGFAWSATLQFHVNDLILASYFNEASSKLYSDKHRKLAGSVCALLTALNEVLPNINSARVIAHSLTTP